MSITSLPAVAAWSSRGEGGTHNDCEQLNEKDREENVPGHWRTGNRRRRTPDVAQHESGDAGGLDNPCAEHRRGNGAGKRGVGLMGILAL